MATMSARYTVIDGEVVAQERSSVRHQLVPDPLGSVVALYDGSGTKTDTFQYWPYGESSGRTGTTTARFQYVGSYGYSQDSSSKNYVRARYLDNTNGRWVTEDPIGLDGGVNLYGYCMNDPITWLDIFGLQHGRPPGSTQGPEGTWFRCDMREQPFPDMHIWHQGGETNITCKGGERQGIHRGQELQKLPARLRPLYRPIIRQFIKQCKPYLGPVAKRFCFAPDPQSIDEMMGSHSIPEFFQALCRSGLIGFCKVYNDDEAKLMDKYKDIILNNIRCVVKPRIKSELR